MSHVRALVVVSAAPLMVLVTTSGIGKNEQTPLTVAGTRVFTECATEFMTLSTEFTTRPVVSIAARALALIRFGVGGGESCS